MVFPVHLQRSAVVAIRDCHDRGQFIGSRSLKQVAPQWIWLFQEALNTEGKYKGIRNYLQACSLILISSQAQRQKLNNSIIFKAFMTLFPEILERCYKRHENFKEESFVDVLKPVSSLDFDEYTGTNNVTLNRILTDIKRELLKAERSESVNSSLLF